jgi:hypothetical protein
MQIHIISHRLELQSGVLILQQLLQRPIISTKMRNVESLTSPILATFIVVAAV